MTLRRSVLAWSVEAILYSHTITVKSGIKPLKQSPTLNQTLGKAEPRIIVYRGYIRQLLESPKSLRDQLIIELPCLEAFRTGEVSSLRVEYIHFDTGDLEVLDSKKRKLFTIPLDPAVAMHLAEYIRKEGLTEGTVLRALPNAPHVGRKEGSKTRGDPDGLSDTHIQYRWTECCKKAGIPKLHPRIGRAYWSVKEHFIEGKSIYYIMAILRHDSLQSTEKYLARLIDYDTIKATFNQGKKSPFTSECTRSMSCPLAMANCFCRMFTPQETVKVKA